MNIIGLVCPKCKRSDALGRRYRGAGGRWQQTCHGIKREGHWGFNLHFNPDTGEVLTATDGIHARIIAAMEDGEAVPLRGFEGEFLADTCGITALSATKMDAHFGGVMPQIVVWGREMEESGFLVAQFPIHRGPHVIGVQLRALRPHEDQPHDRHQIRMFGQANGLFIPHFIGQNPSAVVIFEGPWDAVAATFEADLFQRKDIFSVAILSAEVTAATIKSTLDMIFPGIPRFSHFDQDVAGIAARMATMSVAQPILITGAGPGKDYRDLIPEIRFERLVEIVRRELMALGLIS